MNFKTTYILFGLLGAVLLGLVVAVWLSPVRPPDTSYVFPSAHEENDKVEAKDIDTVEIDRSRPREEKLVFNRTGPYAWKMVEPAPYRIESSQVEGLVGQVLNARRQKDAEVDRNLKRWGLEPPAATITLKGKGHTFQLFLGNEYLNRVYLLSSDQRKDPMIVLRSEIEDVFKPVSDFRSRDLLASRGTDIVYLSLRQGAGEPRILEQRDGLWWFVKPPYGPADYEGATGPEAGKAPTGVRALLDALADVRVDAKTPPPEIPGNPKKDKKVEEKKKKADSGFVEDNAKDLKKYGLESEKTAEMVLAIKRNEEAPAKEGAKSSTKVVPTTLLIGKPVDAKKEQYYARLENEKSVVKVSAKPLETLRKFIASPEELRDHELVHQKPDVIRIKYRSGEEVYLIKTPPAPGPHAAFNQGVWKLYRGKDKKGLVTDQKTVDHLISSLMAKRLVKDYPTGQSDKALGLDSPNAVVSLWTNGVKPPEKKEHKKAEKKGDKTPAKDKKAEKKKEEKTEGDRPELRSQTPDEVLEFGATDSDKRVAVRRKLGKDLKETLVVKVLGSVLELVQADPLSYLEKRLPPLVPRNVVIENVTKITLDLDGKTTEVQRKDPKDPKSVWVYEKPSDLKGRRADTGLVDELFFRINTLRNQAWKALDAKPEQLAKWGLKPPQSRVTITYREGDKTQEKSLLLGKETDDKKAVYAKQSDLGSVFLLAKEDIEKLKGPLLDLTIFDFTASQVKAMKLTVKPKPLKVNMLELERKSAKDWVATKPAGVKINAARAEALVESLEHLRAERFVDKPGGKGAYDLGVKQGALEIEVTLNNKAKEKLMLTVGKAEGGNFYATSNKQPGTVFLIGKGKDGVLETVKKDLASLAVE